MKKETIISECDGCKAPRKCLLLRDVRPGTSLSTPPTAFFVCEVCITKDHLKAVVK